MRGPRLSFFERRAADPPPVVCTVFRTVRFHDLDPMQIVWHGRYPEFFEDAQTALAAKCGFSFPVLRDAGLLTPIRNFHIDYLSPLRPEETFSVTASLCWNDAPKIDMEYVIRHPDGSPATFAYTVQLFLDARTGTPLWIAPDLWLRCQARWKAGEFHAAE